MTTSHAQAIDILHEYKKNTLGWENPADFGLKRCAKTKAPFPLCPSSSVIYVDASKTGKPPEEGSPPVGPTQWQGVTISSVSGGIPTIKTVFKSELHDYGHNNAAEFIAIVDALRLYEQYKWTKIYSDSKTAISWIKRQRTNIATHIRVMFSPDFLLKLEEAENWIKNINVGSRSISRAPKFGYAHDSGQGGEGGPLHTLDEYLQAQILLEMNEAGVPSNQSYNKDEFSILVQRIKDDLNDVVDLENDPRRDVYVKIYCAGYGLDKLKL